MRVQFRWYIMAIVGVVFANIFEIGRLMSGVTDPILLNHAYILGYIVGSSLYIAIKLDKIADKLP